jgi:hypothetical protein
MKKVCAPVLAVVLVLSVGLIGFADTIRLKDGTVIRGQVISFKDQQFTVLLGTGSTGRRSRVTLYLEDVESIEFDSGSVDSTSSVSQPMASDDTGSLGGTHTSPTQNQPVRSSTQNSAPPVGSDSGSRDVSNNSTDSPSQPNPTFFSITTRVRGDSTTNGWTNTGLVVRKGQRIRISATGRVGLGNGRFSTPSGLPSLPDTDKLMRNEATGALIAVISDDNDDFILIGARREFTAQRDGVLFLGVNEGNLNDNTGAFDAVIEAEAK